MELCINENKNINIELGIDDFGNDCGCKRCNYIIKSWEKIFPHNYIDNGEKRVFVLCENCEKDFLMFFSFLRKR